MEKSAKFLLDLRDIQAMLKQKHIVFYDNMEDLQGEPPPPLRSAIELALLHN